jgi:hypothetical protein
MVCRKRYHEFKNEWCGVPEVFDHPDTLEVRVLLFRFVFCFAQTSLTSGASPNRRRLPPHGPNSPPLCHPAIVNILLRCC